MPIRINLLAEQIAVEEARRRDPVKRTLYIGAGLVVLMLIWIATTFAKVKTVESEVARYATRLSEVEGASKEVRANYAEINDIRSRIEALERYANNRFFWGSFLDALQKISVHDLRLTEVRGEHVYRDHPESKLFTTNIITPNPKNAPFWKFWASAHAAESSDALVNRALSTITNRALFQTNRVAYKVKSTVTANQNNTVMKLEFKTKPYSSEQITIELRGRDYGKRAGHGIDEFAENLSTLEFFKEWLREGEGYRFTERPPQPRPDPADPIRPGAMFVPFTIECRIKERIFANE